MTETTVEHSPVNVRIVEDSTRPGDDNPAGKLPRNLDTRGYILPTLGQGEPSIRILTQNLRRARAVVSMDANNTGPVYLADSRPASGNPVVSGTDNAYARIAGSDHEVFNTHELFVFGTAGDRVWVFEESYDA